MEISVKSFRCTKCCLLILLMVTAVFLTSGCAKKTAAPLFEYVEADDGNIHITGLTDRGKTADKLTIPAQLDGKSVVAIESGAFMAAGNLTEVTVEEGITAVYENVFYNCTKLEIINFPSTLESVGTNIVKNTAWEAGQYEQSDIIVINDIFVSAKEGIKSCSVPDGIKVIASGAFYCNAAIEEVSLPDSLEVIESYSFSGCKELKNIELPNSIYKIGYGAFSGCENLTVVCSKNIKNVGIDAFLDVKELIEK